MVPASPTRRAQIIADQIALGAATFLIVGLLSGLAVLTGLFPSRLAPWFLLILATEHISLEATRILIITSRPIRAYIGVFLRGGIWVFAIAILMFTIPSSRSLETVLVWWALGGACSIVFAAVSLRELPWRELRNKRPDWAWIYAGLLAARPFMLTAGGALTISYVDRFMIDGFVGRGELGIYTFYSTISIGILSLGASVSQQFLPKIIGAYASGVAAFRKSVRSFFWSLFAVAGGMIVLAAVCISPMFALLQLDAICAERGSVLFDVAWNPPEDSGRCSFIRPLRGTRRRQTARLQSWIGHRLGSAQHRSHSGVWHIRRGIIELRRQRYSSIRSDIFRRGKNAGRPHGTRRTGAGQPSDRYGSALPIKSRKAHRRI